jgi:hypothetical protein
LGALACGLAICAAWPQTADAAKRPSLAPWSRFASDFTGTVVAAYAVKSGNPWLIAAGVTFKVADLAHDVGDAALARQDRLFGAQMVLADRDAKRLQEIEAASGTLKGDEAQAILQTLSDRRYAMNTTLQSPYGYTLAAIANNLPYGIAKVGVDKAFEWALGGVMKKLGLTAFLNRVLPIPKTVNWALNYGGPLEDVQKGLHWYKLGTVARAAEKAAQEALVTEHANEVEEAAKDLHLVPDEAPDAAVGDAVQAIYDQIMRDHPSQPALVIGSIYRLDVTRAAVMAEPAAAMMAPRPMPAAPEPVAEAAEADPEVGVISADGARVWAHYSGPASSEPTPYVSPSPGPPEEPAWVSRMHAESALVGDGKTYAVCSNGCPSSPNASWTGAAGNNLYN